MKLTTLHQDSYSQLTKYYADLSAPMAALRQQILEIVLCEKKPELPMHFIGNFAVGEDTIPAVSIQNSILDVGCANGDNLNIMRQLGFYHLSGIDIAPEMVATAKNNTELPIHCLDMFEYEGPSIDVVFAQALIHLFPKQDLSKVLRHLLSLSRQRLYFSTTIHDEASEGLEPKFQVVRYRSRYTKAELLAIVHDILKYVNNKNATWRVFYFFLTDCLGKYWINVVFDKIELPHLYEKDGIIVHRDLLNKNVIEKLNEELCYFAGNKAPHNTWLRYDDIVFDRVENFLPFLTSALREELQSPFIIKLLEKCFGNKVVLLKDKCNFKPQGKQTFPLHQDAAAGWAKSGYGNKHITMAISVDHASLENATLQFALGKHREGLFSSLYEVINQEYINKWDFKAIQMMPGDAIIFDSYLPHYSTANDSLKSRKIIFLTFVDAQYSDAVTQFFSQKRLRQPPMDERDSDMQLMRNEYGKWIRKE